MDKKFFFMFLFSIFANAQNVTLCDKGEVCDLYLKSERQNGSDDASIIDVSDGVISKGGEGYDTHNYQLLKSNNIYVLKYSNESSLEEYDYLFLERKNGLVNVLKFISFDENVDYAKGGTYWTAISCVNNASLRFSNFFSAGWELCKSFSPDIKREKLIVKKDNSGYFVSIKEVGSDLSNHRFLFKSEDFSAVSGVIDLSNLLEGYNNLEGKINNKYSISMHISKSDNKLIGSYSYGKGGDIQLSGEIRGDKVNLTEYINDVENARFNLSFDGIAYHGYWFNKEHKYPVILNKLIF